AGEDLGGPEERAVIAAWVEAQAARPDRALAPLLAALTGAAPARGAVHDAVRARVLAGPLVDALASLALLDGAALDDPVLGARAELLIWEAGEGVTSVPELGAWLAADVGAFDRLVASGVGGSLRRRGIAGRTLATAGDGLPSEPPGAVAATIERALRRLASHPEHEVWIPAARAVGRLAARIAEVRRLLAEWLASDNPGEQRRAVTALASLPAAEAPRAPRKLEDMLAAGDPWLAAAIGPAIGHLAVEQRELWQALAARLADEAAPEVLWSVTQGLAAMVRGDHRDRVSEALLRRTRERALAAAPAGATEAQLWRAIRADTDFLDGLEPDPSDPHRLLEAMAASARRVGASRVAERARFTARSLRGCFETALPAAAGDPDPERRAAACATLESCARAAALALWEPILAAAGAPAGGLAAELGETRAAMVRLLAPRLAVTASEHAFHRSALRVLALCADGGEPIGQVLSAVEAAPWLTAGSREAGRFRKPLSDLLWRAVDGTRRATLHHDPHLVPRFAAWWAVTSATGMRLLEPLARTEAAARRADDRTGAAVATIREALAPGSGGAVEGVWVIEVLDALEDLGSRESALAEALAELGAALDEAVQARNQRTAVALERALSSLAAVTARLRRLVADPRLALAADDGDPPPQQPRAEVSALAAAARKDPGFDAAEFAERWSAGLGPLLQPLVAKALTLLLQAHRGLEATAETATNAMVGGYRLVRKLGQGQMGDVWDVCDPDTERHFVMKLPAEAYARISASEKKSLDQAVGLECTILKSIYHPNVANLIDFGWEGDRPFMVLEYLSGVDLEYYLSGGLTTVDELKPVIADVCAGLLALHGRGLVHRDLKPGNIFLRMDLGGPGVRWEARRHRNPDKTPVLGAVIIDFGLSSTGRTEATTGEKLALGTLGFMPPEQARGITNVDGKADVYALGATIFAALTGHAFFEDLNLSATDWVKAHAISDPLAGNKHFTALPRPVQKLLREAASLDPRKRPDVPDFASRFASL
ncbi:MAG TPA: serine/threonine-protein kinase, partial [Kofleriaceae bacterium]|nr:serine/threonine-protein kinase [Kofleriaceae bacterium]